MPYYTNNFIHTLTVGELIDLLSKCHRDEAIYVCGQGQPSINPVLSIQDVYRSHGFLQIIASE